MGYNLSGYLIKGNPDHILQDFARAAGYVLTNRREVTLSDAMYGYRDTDYLHFYASGEGVAIFHIDALFNNRGIDKVLSAGREVITFGISEAAMAYSFEKHADKRSLWTDSVVFEDKLVRTGNQFTITEDTNVVHEIFAPLSKEYTGLDVIRAEGDIRAWRFSVEKIEQPAMIENNAAVEEAPAKPAAAKPASGKADLSRFPEMAKQFVKEILAHKEDGQVLHANGLWLYSFEAWLRAKEEVEQHIPLYCRVMQKASGGKPYKWMREQTKTQKTIRLVISAVLCAAAAVGLFMGGITLFKSIPLPAELANAMWMKAVLGLVCAVIVFLIGFLIEKQRAIVSFKVHDKDEITEAEVLKKVKVEEEVEVEVEDDV